MSERESFRDRIVRESEEEVKYIFADLTDLQRRAFDVANVLADLGILPSAHLMSVASIDVLVEYAAGLLEKADVESVIEDKLADHAERVSQDAKDPDRQAEKQREADTLHERAEELDSTAQSAEPYDGAEFDAERERENAGVEAVLANNEKAKPPRGGSPNMVTPAEMVEPTKVPEQWRHLPAAQGKRVAMGAVQRQASIEKYMAEFGDTLTAGEIAEAINERQDRVGDDLRNMEAAGLVKRTGINRHDRKKQDPAFEGNKGRASVEWTLPNAEPKQEELPQEPAAQSKELPQEPAAQPKEPTQKDEGKEPAAPAKTNDKRITSKNAETREILDAAYEAGARVEMAGNRHARITMPNKQAFMVWLNPNRNDIVVDKSKARRHGLPV